MNPLIRQNQVFRKKLWFSSYRPKKLRAPPPSGKSDQMSKFLIICTYIYIYIFFFEASAPTLPLSPSSLPCIASQSPKN